ncbi:D-alanyl-D-alanine carboxypeptidase [Streptomyces tailanensis]|uniref:D-alanyl-D-alanine carboxypeptidase n=1 Tax=Streptomyces tailanensis TaxID=2569858 RepID=UPI00122DD57E|nr:D-alanyl-D-alanine carboxypeptidase [Streptomyces tailanensis]
MAGTSPDRSKRYESSTESTSGNEAAVPEPAPVPDPRLALTHDPSPKPDQATAVFSRRALREAAEAEGLNLDADEPARVATDADADSGDAEGSRAAAGGSGDGSAADEGERGADGGAGGAEDGDEDGTTAAGEAAGDEREGATDADERTEDDPGAATGDGEAAGGSGGESDDGEAAGGSGAESGDGKAIGGSGAELGDREANEGSEAEAAGDPDAQADAAEEAAAGAEPKADSESGPVGVFAADPARTGDASAADDREADAPVGDEPEADTPEAGGPEADAPAGDAPKPAKPEITAPAAAGAPETDTPVDDEGAGGAPEGDVSTAAEREVDGPEADASAVDAGAAPKAAEPEDDAPAGVAPAADAPEADVAEGDDPEAGAPAGRGPEAADGEDAPIGPPADGDESRTGGAGGETEGDGGAEAERPVDQATAVFRAPRLPEVDHPTTMLKLGGSTTKPSSAETKDDDAPTEPSAEAKGDGDGDTTPPPAERTSKFVALKPLDEPPAPGGSDSPATTPAERTRAIPQVGPELTAQQPLPPRPPLDLLAELTNTPPPPQTPVRTIIRRVKIWTPLVILLAIVFAIVQAFRPLPAPALTLTAEQSYAFKGDKVSLPWPAEGQGWMDVNGIGTMDSFGEQKPVAIGSVAKAMTAYVVLKGHPLKSGEEGPSLTVDALAEKEGGYYKDGESTLATVKEGDKLTERQALSAIMIPSANNIARLLARWDAGTEAAFIKKMNDTAMELGMTNTTYTDASGLKETTVSTAADQVKLGNELVKIPALVEITKLPEWTDPSGQKHRNWNTLVPYNGAIGIKTGSTTKAGGNLLFAATKEVGGETVTLVGAVLGQHKGPSIIDTANAASKTALLAAQDALTSDTVLKKGDVVGYVDDQLGGRTPVVATKDVSAVGWAGKTVKLQLNPSTTIPHEAEAGTKVGSLIIGDGTGDGVEVPVALQTALTEPGFGAKLTRVS